MAVTISQYNQTAAKLLDLGVAPQAANFRFAFLNSSASFTASHTLLDQVSNSGAYLVTGNGAATAGETMTSVAVSVATTNDAKFDAADVTITADGGSIGPTTAGVIFVDEDGSGVKKSVLFYVDFDGAQTATDGNALTIAWNASGIATVTVT